MGEFRLNEVIRTTYPSAVVEASLEESLDTVLANATLADAPRSLLILDRQDRCLGFFTLRKALEAVTGDTPLEGRTVGDFLQTDFAPVQEQDSLFDVIRKIAASKAEASPVVDAAGKTIGVIYLEDLFDRVAEEVLVDVESPFTSSGGGA